MSRPSTTAKTNATTAKPAATKTAAARPTTDEPPKAETRRILDALRRIVRDLRQAGGRGALGPARLYVLQQLAEHGPLAIGDLAARTHTTPPSVSVVVQHLVVAGLLARAPDPADRRRQVLTLTRAGRTALARAPAAAQHGLVAAIDGLPPAQQKTLATLLERVVADAGSPPRAPLFFEDAPPGRSTKGAAARKRTTP